MKKRILSALLVLCMACGLVSTAWAADPATVDPVPVTQSADGTDPVDGTSDPTEVDITTSAAEDGTSAPADGGDTGSDDPAGDTQTLDGGGEEDGSQPESTALADGSGNGEEADGSQPESDVPASDGSSTPAAVQGGSEGTGAPSGQGQPSANNSITVTENSGDMPTVQADGIESRLTPSENGDSAFELKWRRNGQSATVQVILWDSEAGAPITVEQGTLDVYDQDNLYNSSAWAFSADTLPQIDNYTYDTTKGVTYEPYFDESLTSGGLWVQYKSIGGGWRYYNSTTGTNNRVGSGNSLTLHINYTPVEAPTPTGDVTITDDIINSGTLVPSYNGDQYTPDTITYKWYRNGGEAPITAVRVDGTQTNIDEGSGAWLNVALDIESLCQAYPNDDATSVEKRNNIRKTQYTYTVKAYSGETYVGEATYTVPYYAQLMNGSFEDSDKNGNCTIWKTTTENGRIEIGGYDQDIKVYGTEDDKPSDNAGDKFAELNADAAGALYQDVLTVPGKDLTWELAHRARNAKNQDDNNYILSATDTMYVVIMSTKDAEALLEGVNQENQQTVLDNMIQAVLTGGKESAEDIDYTLASGTNVGKTVKVTVTKVTTTSELDYNRRSGTYSSNDQWEGYSGDYTVPEGQYATRFFFASGQTQSGNNTVGNLIDEVWFSPELPTPDPYTGHLTVTKVVSGEELTADKLENYTVEIKVEGNGTSKTQTISGFTPADNGTFTASTTFRDLPVNTQYAVTETPSMVPDGYDQGSSSYVVAGGASGSGTTVSDVSTTDGNTTELTFTNTYEPPVEPQNLENDKYVTLNEDGTYDLSLNVSGAVSSDQTNNPIDVIFVLDTSSSMNRYMGNDNNAYGGYDSRYWEEYEKSRIYYATTAIENLADSLDEADARFSLIEFGSLSDGVTKFGNSNWTDNAQAIKNALPEKFVSTGRGTNYEDPLLDAKGLLSGYNGVRSNAKVVVVFVSDGNPGYYNYGDRYIGTADGYDKTAMERAQIVVSQMQGVDYFFTVGVGDEDNYDHLSNLTDEEEYPNKSGYSFGKYTLPEGMTVGNFNGENETELNAAFNEILTTISTNLTSGVTITDILSKNVAVVKGENNQPRKLVVTVTDRETGELIADIPGNGTSVSVTLPKTDNNEKTTLTAQYVEENGDRKIILDFPNDYKLEPNYTYTATVTIDATEAAYENYREAGNQYPNTSTAVTGAHVGEKGVFTNDSAEVTYDGGKKDYPMPVIQLHPKTLTITKTVQGLDSISDVYKEDLKFTINEGGKTIATVPLSDFTPVAGSSTQFTYTVQGLAPDTQYTVSENEVTVPDYTLDALASDAGEKQVTTPVWDGATSGNGASFINAYKHNDVTLTVRKFVRGNMSKDSDVFTFTLSLTKDNAPYTGDLPYTQFDNSAAQGSQTTTGTKKSQNDVYTFTLSAQDYITFTIPSGCDYTVTEVNNGDYDETFVGTSMVTENEESESNKKAEMSGTATEKENNVAFTNVKAITGPVTGLERHDTPFALMITAAGIAGLALIGSIVARRVRRREE